ncbi:glycoside hydrolase family 2 protein [bacterium]|nr:glycoside hydrolase family 2 protein [bacterium]
MKRLFIWLPVLAVVIFWRFGFDRSDTSVERRVLSDNWSVHAAGDTINHAASIPGNIHLDLLAVGVIDDPFIGENETTVQWISEKDWIYECTFDISGKDKAHDQVKLRFEGLDTYALVTLNDFLILQADNMFRTWSAEVKELLRVGPNHLRIHFRSSEKEDSIRAHRYAVRLPDDRAFSRKAPYQSGWDWGPRLITCGVWRPVILEAWDGPKFEEMQIIQQSISEEKAELKFKFTLNSSILTEAQISLAIEDGDDLMQKTLSLAKGENIVEFDVKINQPRLWWTHDQGHQDLYTFCAALKTDNGVKDCIEKRIGLRNVEIVQTVDSTGSSFEFQLNGRPVFMKGANYIPQDNFLPRVSADQYHQLISSARAANMNMLRVWGGGVYESDLFYDLCDEQGLLIWQDFMFACTMYPGDDAFISNVEHEAIDNIKRLRHHPCVALWCGNNEVDEAFHNWGWQNSLKWSKKHIAEVWSAYDTLFHSVLPGAVEDLHPGAFYWPSSPKIGWGHTQAFLEGDAHYWGVWWGRMPFEMYDDKVGRFMTEYGFQGMPSIQTILAFATSEEQKLGSPVMRAHQKHPFGDENISEYMARDFRVPAKFEDYVYVSQCLQAYGMGRALEAHRRNKPYCMGTLYWQLNDCWPVTSWSSLDYYGRWKALHYEARRQFTPIAILHYLHNDQLSIYINNDSPEDCDGILSLELKKFGGESIYLQKIPVHIQGGGNICVYTITLSESMSGHSVNSSYLNAVLNIDSGQRINRIIHLARPKDQKLHGPEYQWSLKKEENDIIISISSNTLARYVYFSAGDAHFEDNFIDLGANEMRRIKIITGQSIEEIAEKINIISLAETYQ